MKIPNHFSLPVAALTLGVLSFIACPFVLGIAAWVLGQMALNQMDKGLIPPDERNLALWGRSLGFVNVAVVVVVYGLIAARFVVFVPGVFDYYQRIEEMTSVESVIATHCPEI